MENIPKPALFGRIKLETPLFSDTLIMHTLIMHTLIMQTYIAKINPGLI
jgi:hypothetical protein